MKYGWFSALVVSLVLCSCTPQASHLTPAVHPESLQRKSAAGMLDVPNLFSNSRSLNLADTDLDAYITGDLSPQDRALAHRLMAMMPPSQRGDFVYRFANGRIISNNAALLPKISVTQAAVTGPLAYVARPPAARRGVRDYSSYCAPPPPSEWSAFTERVKVRLYNGLGLCKSKVFDDAIGIR